MEIFPRRRSPQGKYYRPLTAHVNTLFPQGEAKCFPLCRAASEKKETWAKSGNFGLPSITLRTQIATDFLVSVFFIISVDKVHHFVYNMGILRKVVLYMAVPKGKYRITITVSDEAVDKLSYYGEKMGMNRSALCAYFVGQGLLGLDKSYAVIDKVTSDMSEEMKKVLSGFLDGASDS